MDGQSAASRFDRIMVANRGEIALRVMRACRELGIETVAVYGDGEERAAHVRYANDAYRIRSAMTVPYLDGEALLDIATRCGAEAVHPGYGFLSENATFAQAVSDAGLVFIGPPPPAISAMGDKVAARAIARSAGVEPVPGTLAPVASIDEAVVEADAVGYPVAVKASGGGGGRGFRVARQAADLAGAFAASRGEAERYFSNTDVYLERYLEQPRHVEMQVFADEHGAVVAFPERDCSVQRRHQKLIEESPSPAIEADVRTALGQASERLVREVGYRGAGTIEFLLDAAGAFYFLEMNTRIQVEHTVTEMVTGIDLVREQIRVAAGHRLSFSAADVEPRGWAIECRVNAEDAGRDFAPTPGIIAVHRMPTGFGVRVDAALEAGDAVSPGYDSLIAKVIGWGRDRSEAISRVRRALEDYEIAGVPTTIPFHLNVLSHPAFVGGKATTIFLTDHPEVIPPSQMESTVSDAPANDAGQLDLIVEIDGHRFATIVRGLGNDTSGASNRSPSNRRRTATPKGASRQASHKGGATLLSPLQGTVLRVDVTEGDAVEAGALVCVVEAMKMENELHAHTSGVVSRLHVAVGSSVSLGAPIVEIESTKHSS